MKANLVESIETLKTVSSFVNEGNEISTNKLAEVVDAMNLVLKAKLWYSDSIHQNDDELMRINRSNLMSDKLKLISLISNL